MFSTEGGKRNQDADHGLSQHGAMLAAAESLRQAGGGGGARPPEGSCKEGQATRVTIKTPGSWRGTLPQTNMEAPRRPLQMEPNRNYQRDLEASMIVWGRVVRENRLVINECGRLGNSLHGSGITTK